jgi:hypothetical protein
VEKYGRARQVTDDNTVWRMRFTCWITKAYRHTLEYVMLIAFHGSNGYANAFQCYFYTYVACLVLSFLPYFNYFLLCFSSAFPPVLFFLSRFCVLYFFLSLELFRLILHYCLSLKIAYVVTLSLVPYIEAVSFIAAPSTAASSHGKPTSAGTSRDSSGAHGGNIGNTL